MRLFISVSIFGSRKITGLLRRMLLSNTREFGREMKTGAKISSRRGIKPIEFAYDINRNGGIVSLAPLHWSQQNERGRSERMRYISNLQHNNQLFRSLNISIEQYLLKIAPYAWFMLSMIYEYKAWHGTCTVSY